DEVLQPGHEFGGIERLVRPQRQRLHVLIMVVLEAAMAMIVIMVMIVTVMMMMVMIVAVAGLEKFRLEFENTVEIEGAAFQYIRQRDLAALGALQLGIGV